MGSVRTRSDVTHHCASDCILQVVATPVQTDGSAVVPDVN